MGRAAGRGRARRPPARRAWWGRCWAGCARRWTSTATVIPGLLGGGDCNDGDKAINPAAQDWPEDGVDQDCDGVDLRAADLRPPPLHPVPAPVPPNLNILLIVIDTLRADRLGAYGYPRPTSPELDRLARDGVLFENAWAHAPSTRYSMPAIVTGRWPSAIKWDMSIWWPGIARDQPTIAEVLRAARATSTAPTTPIRTSTASTAAASSAASISTTIVWRPNT